MVLKITSVHLAFSDAKRSRHQYNIICENGIVRELLPANDKNEEISTSEVTVIDGKGGILLPSLCHSHIHLDKCYILEKGAPLITSDFQEALWVTSHIKSRFKHELEDLYARGSLLVRQSVMSGVTSMRTHVEVDQIVNSACLQVADRIRKEWAKQCDIHIAVFMQDPLFEAEGDKAPGPNAACLAGALSEGYSISAIGSAPYVENNDWQAKWNIRHIILLAMEYNLHVDFHLDYNLSSSKEPLIYYVIHVLNELSWLSKMPGKIITIGHATRLSLFSADEYRDLRQRVGRLPIVFVGLPQSDVYMMGRGDSTHPRGTLRLPQLIKEYDLDVAMSVNNVGNAFTPQGYPDPLALCPLGVAIYQLGGEEPCRMLLSSITITSKRAIGEPQVWSSLVPVAGDKADFVILHENNSLWSAALSPSWDRTTIKSGSLTARRESKTWTSFDVSQ